MPRFCTPTALRPLLLCLGLLSGSAESLMISEYVEGSSNNKAIEIVNLDPATTRFSGVELRLYSNGNTSGSLLIALGDLDLAPGQTYVVTHTLAGATLTARANRTVGGTWFNGNDAVELRVAGSVHDLFGRIGLPDPGVGWSSGGVQTVDRSLRRRASVCVGVTGNPATFDPSLQWSQASLDDFSDLGRHTHACLGAPVATPIAQIQGTGGRSLMHGRMVRIEGVLTGAAMTSSGNFGRYLDAPALYLQSEAADSDPASSEGIAIHAPMLSWNASTRSFATAGAASLPLGALLRVEGSVEEWHASNNCMSAGELRCETRIRPTTISVLRPPVLAGGVPQLPAAIDLSMALPADLAADSTDHLERYEGMRVSSGSAAFVSGPSKYFEDNPGPLIAVDVHPRSQSAARLVRERAAYAIGLRNWMSRGFSDTRAFPPNLAVGARINRVDGPLTYDFDSYRLVAQPGSNWSVASARAVEVPAAQPAAATGEFTVATFNTRQFGVENLAQRVPKLVQTIRQLGCPSIMALQEVATPVGTQQIVNAPPTPGMGQLLSQLAAAGCAYDVTLSSHPDSGDPENAALRYGIATLVRRGVLPPGGPQPPTASAETWQTCHVLGSSAAAGYDPLACPAGQWPLYSRRPVVLRMDQVAIDHLITRADGSTQVLKSRVKLTLVNVHLKSQLNASDDARRVAETQYLAERVRSEHTAGRQVIVLGDFNTPHLPAPDSRFLAPLRDADLVATWDVMDPWQRYSSNFRGVSGVLDHILLSRSLYAPVGANTRTRVLALNSDWPARGEGLPGAPGGPLQLWAASPVGSSDHDPVWLQLGGQALHPEFQAALRECVLAFVCGAFRGIGGNPADCGSRRTGVAIEAKSDTKGADPLEPYRSFRDRWMTGSAGLYWQQVYYAASPALSDLVTQDPSLGIDLLALMLRFGDAFERVALGVSPDPGDTLDRATLERLRRVHQRVLDKLSPELTAPIAQLMKPSDYAAYEGQSSYLLIKHLLQKAGIW